ncbi:MAG: protein kinase domain-containing protein [Xenococcaceae cyanobacterium]
MPIGRVLLKRYKIIEAIGSGAFGNTYLAVDTAFPGKPRLVVKHLQPKNTDPKNLEVAKRLFQTEANVLSRLGEHSQIPRLFAHFEEDKQFFLVQESIEGHNLTREFQPGKKWSEAETIKFLQELLEVLSFVHQQNTIHRDLKPANIMRRQKDGKLVLIDFGAVKEILTINQQETTSAPSTISIGTPPYMSPEQGIGKPGKYSDIYAVGMLGIQAITGLSSRELPQDLEHLEQVWKDHNIEISSQLKSVLERMVSFQPKQRYADATEALKAIIPTVVELPETKPITSRAKTGQFQSQGKLFFSLLGILGLTGMGWFGLKFINQPNYAQLEAYLKNRQWQQADTETDKLILKIARENSALDTKSSQNFPCRSLQKIDELWTKNSDEKLGYTPQKQAYLETGNEFNEYVESTYEAFGKKVGWRILGAWKRYEDLNFQAIDPNKFPSGYLPSPGKVAADKQDLRIREREMLLSRFNDCSF